MNIPIKFSIEELQYLFDTYYLELQEIWDPKLVYVPADEWNMNIVNKIARISVEDEVMEAGTKVRWLGFGEQGNSYHVSGGDPAVHPTVDMRGVVILNEQLIGEVETFEGFEGNYKVELIRKLGQMVQVNWLAPNGEIICTAWHTPDQLAVLS